MTRIHFIAGPKKRRPLLGDRKVVNGITYVRRVKIINHPLFGKVHVAGRTEWVAQEAE